VRFRHTELIIIEGEKPMVIKNVHWRKNKKNKNHSN
jgi:hypothetical protein